MGDGDRDILRLENRVEALEKTTIDVASKSDVSSLRDEINSFRKEIKPLNDSIIIFTEQIKNIKQTRCPDHQSMHDKVEKNNIVLDGHLCQHITAEKISDKWGDRAWSLLKDWGPTFAAFLAWAYLGGRNNGN